MRAVMMSFFRSLLFTIGPRGSAKRYLWAPIISISTLKPLQVKKKIVSCAGGYYQFLSCR